MTRIHLPALWLRLRLAARGPGPVAGAALLVTIAALALLAYATGARAQQARAQAAALAQAAAPPAPAVVAATPQASANDNLTLFYASLGERRYTEQQVKTLFGLAAKTGLVLRQGEYKAAYDQNGRLHTYQVTLPVKGSYQAVWQFAMLALRAIPFAALDDIGFRRDDISAPGAEARVRFTLYLADGESAR